MSRFFLPEYVEPAVACCHCKHSHPVPDGEAGAERNVYCRLHTIEEHPRGLKIRRDSFCDCYAPDEMTARDAGAWLLAKKLEEDISELTKGGRQ